MESYFPFDAGAGASISEAQWRKMAQHWQDSGVLARELNVLEVYGDGSGMQVKVKSGRALILGHFYENDAEIVVPVLAAHATLARLDMVVLRADFVANTITTVPVTGTAAASPVAPALTKNDSVWEIPLALVSVAAAATQINAAKVTDEREQVATKGDKFDPGAVTIPPSGYPAGFSIAVVNTTDGWPFNGTLTTFKRQGSRMWQELVASSAALVAVQRYFRQGFAATGGIPDGWGPWQNVLDGGTIQTATVGTTESTTATAFAALTTAGPAVPVGIGPSGKAMVIVSARIIGAAATDDGLMGFAVSGATTRNATDADALRLGGDRNRRASVVSIVSGLTPGSNTFTAQYKTGGAGTATFTQREIAVLPL